MIVEERYTLLFTVKMNVPVGERSRYRKAELAYCPGFLMSIEINFPINRFNFSFTRRKPESKKGEG